MAAIFHPKKTLSWTLQAFSGPDARDFLHRLTTVNLHRMGPGDGALGFFLSAVGKVRAQFFLSCLEESPQGDRFVFEYDAGAEGEWTSALAGAIDQFTFAERQTLEAPSQDSCLWVFLESDEVLPARPAEAQWVVLDRGVRDFGWRWISLWGPAEQLERWRSQALPQATELETSALELRRIRQVRPWPARELTVESMPLELGLYDGVAENKGCYPGQEVMERIITQGAPPKRLVLVELSSKQEPPSEPVSAGTPTVEASSWQESLGLCLVRKNLAVVGQKLSISGRGEATVVHCSPDRPFEHS